jgi:hypothetical protein
MKIKCPVCDSGRSVDLCHRDILENHYQEYHHILEKIHEKIESLENEKRYWDKPFAIDSSILQLSIFHSLETLKSLLENK